MNLDQGDIALMVANARGLASLGMAGGYDEVLYELSDALDALHERAEAAEAALDDLREQRDALAEAQQFPVETVMSWKRRAEGAEAMNRYARILLDPQRQDEPDEENALRAYEALSGIPLTVPADRVLPERTLELVRDVCERGVGPDTTPEEALQTIENLINKRHPREQL